MGPVVKAFMNRKDQFLEYATKGAYHMMGAETKALSKDGDAIWNLFGGMMQSTRGQLGLRAIEGAAPSPLGSKDMFGLAVTMGSTAMMAGMGYMEGGVGGMGSALIADVAVNAALVEHGYKWKKLPGGGKVRAGGGVLNLLGRNLGGALVAGAATHAVGGGLLGVAAGFAGGHIGVKHTKKLAMAFGGYHAAKMTGNAVMGVLKQGNAYRQRQRSISTSGSLAAFNTQGAHTMRQRAVQAIHKSHLNARSALGSEAQFMHMPSRNYHSRYR